MTADARDALVAVLVIGTVAWLAVRRVLPGRRLRRAAPPLPQMAGGPRAPVPPRIYAGGHPSRVVTWMARVSAALAVACVAASGGADGAVFVGLAIACAIIAGTMAFANWFATRVRIRVDAEGLHARTFYREVTVRWRDVSGLRLRHVVLGSGVRLVYYCVQGGGREVAFPSSMQDAAQLQRTIEAATGLSYPAPDIVPNM